MFPVLNFQQRDGADKVTDKSAWQKSSVCESEAVEDILTNTQLLPHAGPKSAKHMKERRQHIARILSKLTRVIFWGGGIRS